MNLNSFTKYYTRYKNIRDEELSGVPHEKEVVENYLRALVEDSEFITYLKTDTLSQIIECNEYKAISTLCNEKSEYEKGREEALQVLFGKRNITAEDWPKYGMLSDKNILKQTLKDGNAFYQYGPVIIHWKKKNLFNSTTLTIGNSLNFGQFYYKCPTFLSDCSAVSLMGTDYHNGRTIKDSITSIKDFASNIENGRLSLNAYSIGDVYGAEAGYEFYELQFHKRLIITEDAEEILYFSGLDETCDSLFHSLIPQLEEKGIKWGILDF